MLSFSSVSGSLTFPDKTILGRTFEQISLIAWNKLPKMFFIFRGVFSIYSAIKGARFVVKTGLNSNDLKYFTC